LFFTILQPGVVGVLIPYLLLRNSCNTFFPTEWTVWHFAGAFLIVVGAAILLRCVLRFVTEGKGTISPVDPTKKLIIKGLYKYSRNPMYVGMMILLAGEAIFWRSLALTIYAAVIFVAFNLFVILHEEPRLRRVFGEEYEEYFQNVRRWL
jgi:protein-S-isoprenylcysteine O-methyltransferase Ste14